MRTLLVGIAALVLATPAPAQRIDTGEILGGAAYNVALRIPLHFFPKAYRGVVTRAVIYHAGSGIYELCLDPHHPGNLSQARADFLNRSKGYLAAELVVAGVKRLFFHKPARRPTAETLNGHGERDS